MPQPKSAEKNEARPAQCCENPYDELPPELRPKAVLRAERGLREVQCPSCGMEFLTNRTTDYCIHCGP